VLARRRFHEQDLGRVASERGYAQPRGLRNRLRVMSWSSLAWRKGTAISR